jgi:hypothetical protein
MCFEGTHVFNGTIGPFRLYEPCVAVAKHNVEEQFPRNHFDVPPDKSMPQAREWKAPNCPSSRGQNRSTD